MVSIWKDWAYTAFRSVSPLIADLTSPLLPSTYCCCGRTSHQTSLLGEEESLLYTECSWRWFIAHIASFQ